MICYMEKNTNNPITISQVLDCNPCPPHDETRLLEISGGRREMTAMEIAYLANVPASDRIWLLARPEIMGEKNLVLWSCDCAEHVLPIWETWAQKHAPQHLDASRKAIETKRQHIDGNARDEELQAAGAAARAAWAAARASARASARAAAWASAGAAERERQIGKLREYLGMGVEE